MHRLTSSWKVLCVAIRVNIVKIAQEFGLLEILTKHVFLFTSLLWKDKRLHDK